MSREKTARPYRLQLRAESMEDTRRRIAKAAFELHGIVGPARTTIAGVAHRAGVERATVYRHYPDELSLFRACVSHGMTTFPPPDLSAWEPIEDPAERLRVGLTELYAFYRRTETTWFNVLRDMPDLPLLQQANAEAGLFEYFDRVGSLFARDWKIGGRNRAARQTLLHAAIEHFIEFPTWHSLARRHGLSDEQAAKLAGVLVDCLVTRDR